MGNGCYGAEKNPESKKGGVPKSQKTQSQAGNTTVPNQKKQNYNNNSLNVSIQQHKEVRQSNFSKDKNKSSNIMQEDKILRKEPSNFKDSNTRSEIKESTYPQQKTEKNLKISQLSINLVQTNVIRSELLISALKAQCFDGEQFKGKKVKQFAFTAQQKPIQLVKEQDYFDESLGAIDIKPQMETSVAKFSMGDYKQANTYPTKTYLFDRTLNDRLVA